MRCFYWMAWVNGLATSVLLPSLWPFISALGGNSEQYGIVVSSFGVCSFVSNIIFGRLSDQPGARGSVLACTFAIGAVGSATYAFTATATPLGSHSWLHLLLGRALMGVGDGRCSVIAAAVTEMTDPADLAARMAHLSMCTLLGNILGPLVGLWLNEQGIYMGFEGPAIILAGAMLLNAVMALGVPTPAAADERGAVGEDAPLLHGATPLPLRSIVFMMASHAVFWFCWYSFEVLMPVVADKQFACATGSAHPSCLMTDPTNLNAVMYAGFAVVGVVSYVSVRPLTRVVRELTLLTFHAALFTSAAVPIAHHFWTAQNGSGPISFGLFCFSAVAVIISFTQGEALNSAVFSLLIPRDSLGKWQGYFTCVGALSPAAGAFLMTRVYHDQGRGSFLLLAGLMAALCALLFTARSRIQPALDDAKARSVQ